MLPVLKKKVSRDPDDSSNKDAVAKSKVISKCNDVVRSAAMVSIETHDQTADRKTQAAIDRMKQQFELKTIVVRQPRRGRRYGRPVALLSIVGAKKHVSSESNSDTSAILPNLT